MSLGLLIFIMFYIVKRLFHCAVVLSAARCCFHTEVSPRLYCALLNNEAYLTGHRLPLSQLTPFSPPSVIVQQHETAAESGAVLKDDCLEMSEHLEYLRTASDKFECCTFTRRTLIKREC